MSVFHTPKDDTVPMANIAPVTSYTKEDVLTEAVPVQRLSDDDGLSVWAALIRYRRLGFFCFLAGLTAALDGFQGKQMFHGRLCLGSFQTK